MALSKTPEDKADFIFPNDDPEVFRHITLWLYSGKLFERDDLAVSAEFMQAIAGYDSDETIPDGAIENDDFGEHLSDSHESNSTSHYPENTTDASSPTIQQDQMEHTNEEAPSGTPVTPHSTRSPDRDYKWNDIDTPQDSAISSRTFARPIPDHTNNNHPPIPLSTLLLTKIYAFSERLGINALCNELISLLAARLASDMTLPLEALTYAFGERCKTGSQVRELLVDFAGRHASMNELLQSLGAQELPREMLVALLKKLGPLRRVEGNGQMRWEEFCRDRRNLMRYCIG